MHELLLLSYMVAEYRRKALTSKFLGRRISCRQYFPKPHFRQASWSH